MNASFVNWITSQLLICVTLTTLSLAAVAEATTPDVQKHYTFDLPQQSVADSLNDLATQTGAQFLFPFQLAQSKTAKPIIGHFTLLEATAKLLQNTGLKSDLVGGVLTISPADDAGTSGNQNHKGKRMNITTKKSLLATMVGLFAATGAVQQASGQDGEAATAQGRIDEIIVTASKRATSLQETALSVSAISGKNLSKLGITNFDQILATIPGATVIEAGPGSSRVSYRGVATNNTVQGNGGNDTTSTYIDEFPLAVGDQDIKLVDMAQIEVLKGPQGTLYGQSALGGVMRFITNKPTTEAIEGGMDITYEDVADGNTGYQGQGYINIPLSDNLAVRGVFYDYDSAGFIDNLGTGTKDINTNEVTGGRLALRWDISDRTAFNLLYLNQTSRIGGGQGVLDQSPTSTYTPVQNGLPTDTSPPDLDNPSYRSNIDGFLDKDFEALNLKFDISFDNFDLSLMGATKQREFFSEKDSAIWIGIYDDVTVALDRTRGEFEGDTFEGRLVSSGDGPLEWIAGVWYEKEDGGGNVPWTIEMRTPRTDLPLVDGDILINRKTFQDKEELSVYGEVGYRITDQAKLTLGYRRSDLELNSGVLSATGPFDGGALAAIGVDERTQEDINTYKIHFEYRFNDDILAYALASSGYRAGGFNRSGIGQVSSVSPYGTDTLWNYEVGVRSSWLENRLTANAVTYYIDWSDIQLRQWDPIAAVQKIQNAGEAENFGLETEIRYQVTDNLQLSANYAYIDASMAEDFIDEQTDMVIAGKGDRLPGSSKNAFSLFVDWQRSLSSGLELLVNVNYRYTSSRPNAFGVGVGLTSAFLEEIPSTEVVNLSAGIKHDSGVTVSLFSNNLLDERSPAARLGVGVGADLEAITMNRPRTIGLRAGYQF